MERQQLARAECSVTGCTRLAIARGLCRLHYTRAREGRPLDPEDRTGQPDGYGRYGILDRDEDTALCHECGGRFASIAGHLPAHGMTARQYKLAHGLPLGLGLVSLGLSRRVSQTSIEHLDSPEWRRLEEARDPAAAAAARDAASFAATGRHHRREPGTARANGQRARVVRVIGCPICDAQWCHLAGHPAATCSEACRRELLRRRRLQQQRDASAG